MTFRPYQQKIVDDIRSAWQSGARNVLAQLPTGGGKAVIARTMVKEHEGASLLMAHRQELVSQLSLHLAREAVSHRLIAPKPVIANVVKIHRETIGKSFVNPSALNVVGSVQTLAARGPEDWHKQITLVLPDEAHHYLRENTFGKTASMFPNAFMAGFTATPQRADGRGLGAHADGIFHQMVQGPTPRELINAGYLSDYQVVMPVSNFDRARLTIGSSGDFTEKSLRDESERSQIVGDVVNNYIMWAAGTQCVVFAASVDAAEKIAAQFNERGIPAACISAKNDDYERFAIMRRFASGQIKVLTNCDLLGEGVDVPEIATVIMARATESLPVFLQQIGRALRPAPGKKYALLIDHVGNVIAHGLPDRARFWTLNATKNKREKDPDDIPITQCDNCMMAYERVLRACPYCGAERLKVIMGPRTVEQVDGDLMLLDAATLAKMRAAVELESPASIANRVAGAAGSFAGRGVANKQLERLQSQRALADMIAIWAGIERAKGRSDDESYRRFYLWLGVDVLSALSLGRKEMDELRERISRYVNT